MAKIEIRKNPIYIEDIKTVLNLKCDWLQLKNKTILITGATGLIGTVVVDMLQLINSEFNLNLKLLLISRHAINSEIDWITYLVHDINEPFSYSDRVDYIIHAASNTHPKLYSTAPIETITTNLFGTFHLLNLAKENKGCRFINLSSVEIYGENLNSSTKFKETDMGYLDCNTVRAGYCEAKRTCETLCQSFYSQYNVDFVTARLCRCYGPTIKDDDTKAISQFIKNGVNKNNIVLKSEGKQLYSYLYASDAACAILFLMLNGKTAESYNVSDEKSDIHLFELAKIIAELSEVSVVYDLPDEVEKKGFSTATTAILDPTKINNLGWKACYSIYNGLVRTLDIITNGVKKNE